MRFSVGPFKNPSGTIIFRVSGTDANGLRIRENKETMPEAIARQQELESAYRGTPRPMWERATGLSAAQLSIAEAAFSRLSSRGLADASLFDAVESFLACGAAFAVKKALVDAVAEFVAERTKNLWRPTTAKNNRDVLARFVRKYPAALVATVTKDELQKHIDRDGNGKYARDTERKVLCSFFNWAVKQNFCAKNPVNAVAKVSIDASDIAALSLDACKALVASARTYKGGACLSYVALGLFCAIRPTEIERLANLKPGSSSRIDLEAGHVIIGADIAKTHSRRIVEIPANALALLREASGKEFCGKNWRKDFDAVKAMTGAKFCHDILRHTGISYRIAANNDENKTATWAGNSPAVIHKHYRALVNPAGVAEFWNIGL